MRLIKFIFLLLAIPLNAFAEGPPLWCASKIGNTFELGCDRYFSSRHEAALWLAEEQKSAKASYPEWQFTADASVASYFGQNDIAWSRPAKWWNGTYGVWVNDSASGSIFPYCPPVSMGPRYNGGTDESKACGGLEISIDGASSTKSLPDGPPLNQTVVVKSGSLPVGNTQVSVKIMSGEQVISTLNGLTDSSGTFLFKYVPPFFVATEVLLQASCSRCNNIAQKTISVHACEIDQCDPTKGNPIQPGSAEKLEIDVDWPDASAHPLSVVRTYRSFGNAPAGLGKGWSHRFAGVLEGDGTSRIVRLGDGTKSIFIQSPDGQWVGAAGHTLTEAKGIWTYSRLRHDEQWLFDAQGRLQSIVARNGWAYRLTYNPQGQLTSVANAFGRNLQFSYSPQGLLSSITLPGGLGRLHYGFASGQLSTAQDPDGNRQQYVYEDPRWPFALTGRFDASGQRVGTYAYDAQGRAVSTTGPGGVGGYVFSYDSAGVGPMGALVSPHAHDPNWYKAQVTITNPQGHVEIWQYQGGDGQVRVAAVNAAFEGHQVATRRFLPGTTLPAAEIDFLGTQQQVSWNQARRLPLTQTRAANQSAVSQTTTTQWHPSLRLPTKITETGAQGGTRITEYTYDERGNRLSESISGDGLATPRIRRWTYTAQNLVATETDESGATTTHSYDQWGNRTSTTDPLGKVRTLTYDAAGRVLSDTRDGLRTTYTYDLRGRLLTQNMGGLVTTMSYLPTGLLASIAQPNGYVTQYQYDAAHRLIGWSDNRGNSGSYVLDGMGNRTHERITDAQGRTVFELSRTLNAINRVDSQTVGGNQSATYQYDANGDLIGHANALGQGSSYTLDALRRLSAERNPLNATATIGYNSLNAVVQARDFKGVATQYERDAQGNALNEASADIGSHSSQYDARSLIVSTQDAQQRQQHIQRDSLGRPTHISASGEGASASSSFSYDSTSGQLSSMQEPGLHTGYQRDSLGRPTRKSQHLEATP